MLQFAIFILALGCIGFAYLYFRVRLNNHLLCLDFNRETQENEDAWEQGRLEIVEGYEADLLDKQDKIDGALEGVVEKMREIALLRERLTECQHIVEMQKEAIEIIDDEKAGMLSQLMQHQQCLVTIESLRVEKISLEEEAEEIIDGE